MMIDLARARRETPGCDQVLHFNNAGAALQPQTVLDSVRHHLDLEAARGGYEAAAMAHEPIEGVYDSIATLVGSSRHEIAIVENATRAWDMAFYALPLGTGDRILTASTEYASNYIAFLQVAARTGATVEVIPAADDGALSVAALEEMIDERVKLIAISHVPTNGGVVQPAGAVGRVARAAGITYLLDACQSVGQMPVDVAALGCDLLAATSRKYLRGPRGAGFLYVRESLIGGLEPPFLDLHAAEWISAKEYRIRDDARRFETWEGNVAAKLGLGAAADYALTWGLDSIYHWVQVLAGLLRERLAELPGVEVRDLGAERCGIVSFSATQREPADIRDGLRDRDINVSVSTPASTMIDAASRSLPSLVRASVHYYNTEAEVERFCEELAAVIGPGGPTRM